jgi:amino acid transporter
VENFMVEMQQQADSAAKRAAQAPPGELERVMGPFASFAIALSTICILAGGITSFHVGFCSVGGAAIGLGWPLCCLFSLTVALTMGQVASAFPHAGGPYQWAAILGGRGWGWATACFGLAGLITVVAAINVGTCRFVVCAMADHLEYKPAEVHPHIQALAVVLMTLSQALVNHRGMRLTSWLIDMSGYLIIVVALALTAAMLVLGAGNGSLDPERLVTFANYSGSAGGDVLPATENVAWLFALGLLLPAYTFTGFDAPAQTAEETFDPRRNVPRGIVRSVLVSGLAGWAMLAAIVLAIPNMDEAASKGDQVFFWILQEVVPQPLRTVLSVGMIAAMYLCGLAMVTSTSRLAYGLARDGGLPFSTVLRRIGSHHTPSAAIWAVAGVAALFAVAVPYEASAAVCAIFLYLAYVLPTALGFWTHGRRWTRMGPWHLGRWYRPLAVVCVLGCIMLIVIGMQPPNEIAVPIVAATVGVMVVLWFGYIHRHFPGPPASVLQELSATE